MKMLKYKQSLCGKGLTTLQGIDLTDTTDLMCYENKLTSLPTLPATLEHLWCYDNQLTSLGTLPPNLKLLNCENNNLTSLPPLPSSLTHLYCSKNLLTSLLPLPKNLIVLHCWDCQFDDPDLLFGLEDYNNNTNPGFLVKIKLFQHNNKRKKLGLQLLDKLPEEQVWDDINDRFTASLYEPGGEMFVNCQLEIEKLINLMKV